MGSLLESLLGDWWPSNELIDVRCSLRPLWKEYLDFEANLRKGPWILVLREEKL